MALAHKIQGESMQMIIFQLDEGQRVYCEAGKFLWKTVNVSMETRLGKGDAADQAPAAPGMGGLLNKAMKTGVDMGKRHLAGESLAFQHFTATGGSGLVSFAGVLPGHMRVFELDGTHGLVRREGRVRGGREHGELRHRVPGRQGRAQGRRGLRAREVHRASARFVIAGAGNFIELNPAKYGGKIQVDTGCVVAFQDSITYGIEKIGALNAQTLVAGMFGGEGLNLATLEGDGTVILQSMTYDGMANALFARRGQDDNQGITGGIFGTSKG